MVYQVNAAAGSQRTTLRRNTRDALRSRIVDGRLLPGANIVERQLGKDLGVSRTPLREALLGLEAQGLLRAEPQRGFFVLEMSINEAREIYPLIGLVEAFAVEQGKPPASDHLKRLNKRFRTAIGPAQAVQRDREWHEELLRQCQLPHTAATLEGLRTAAARYEYRFFTGRRVIAESARQHHSILDALRRRQYSRAAILIKRNWEQGLQWVERNFSR